ncbi:MAG TPA: hypothetical protein VL361_13240 [Candidatus Limnocylindrales bacterium]|jgi:hypothetical protein|nr:hypothetical protein [Candidatus Limnocylindrales bacterium]
MDADEREICLYLRGWPGQFVSIAEITRRAGGKRRGRQDPNWALPVLSRLVERGVLEVDSTGHYRFIPRHKKEKKKRFISPHIQKILEKSGKSFDGVFDVKDEDDDLPEHMKG